MKKKQREECEWNEIVGHWRENFADISFPLDLLPEFRKLESEYVGALAGETFLSIEVPAEPGSSLQSYSVDPRFADFLKERNFPP
jgi:hypothetical protein